jgi:hypothetical protein
MEIYFSPEVVTPHFQVLNVINSKEQAVGNVAFLFGEKKMYVYGILEEEAVEADFKDLLTPYIKGMAKAKEGLEVFSCVYVGCEKVKINGEDKP